jgi:hypothetical protein
LQFTFSLDNLSQELNSQQLTNCNYSDEQQINIDEKFTLHQNISIMQHPTVTPILGKEEFAGQFNFQLILNHQNSGKHWVVSSMSTHFSSINNLAYMILMLFNNSIFHSFKNKLHIRY